MATGHTVLVDNLVGAGGIIATSQLVRAPKDGLTLELVSSNHVINPGIYKSMPYDTLRDITPIELVGSVPLLLVANISIPATNVKEFIALMKAKPGTFNEGTSPGTTLQVAGELFKKLAGVERNSVPYRGSAQVMTDVIGGQIDYAFVPVPGGASLVKAGKLRALGVTTAKRSTALPDVPTIGESGLPGFAFDSWMGLIGPAGMDSNLVNQRRSQFQEAMKQPELKAALLAQGVMPLVKSPSEIAPFFAAELKKHLEIMEQAGITPS